MEKPLVSVITVTFNLIDNNRKISFIKAIESVHEQTYRNIEHLVIDGASDDGTVELIKEYSNKGWLKYISEPDKSLYDAMNKGGNLATGKYILFLNSDDYFVDIEAIEKSVELLERKKADYSYAKANVMAEEGKYIKHRHNEDNLVNVFTEMPFCHQTLLLKTELFKELGMFDLQYQCASDYDFVFKLTYYKARHVFVPITMVTYSICGCSNECKEISIRETLEIIFKNYSKLINITKEESDKIFVTKMIPLPLLLKLIKNTRLGFFNNLKLLSLYLRRSLIRLRISLKYPYFEFLGKVIVGRDE